MRITTTRTAQIDATLKASLFKVASADDPSLKTVWGPNGSGAVGITASRLRSIIADLEGAYADPSDVIVALDLLRERNNALEERVWLDPAAARLLSQHLQRLGASWFEPIEGSPIPNIPGLVV